MYKARLYRSNNVAGKFYTLVILSVLVYSLWAMGYIEFAARILVTIFNSFFG